MNPQDNVKYNLWFEKNCHRRGGHFRIELEDLKPLQFSGTFKPENIKSPVDGNKFCRELMWSREYLYKFVEYPTYSQQ